MREAFSAIWQAAAVLLGAAVFAVVMWWVAKAHSRMWRLVAARYPGGEREPTVARRMDTLVLARPGPLRQADYRQYAGALISVNPKSLTFSLIPPVNVMCPPFSVPFDHMELEQTSWALWPEPFAIRMKKQPEIDIIVGRDTVQWIRSQTDQKPFGWDI